MYPAAPLLHIFPSASSRNVRFIARYSLRFSLLRAE